MLAHEDLKWLAASATELNHLLQQAARQAEQVRQSKGRDEHLDALNERVERASRASQAIFDRITTRILAGAPPNDAVSGPPPAPILAAGASVSVKMPVGEIAIDGEGTSHPTILNPKGERELILLVDDDLELLERTGEILDFEDYRFIIAKDGLDALQIYRRMADQIDLVILDYFLPVMDGDAVFDELRAINPKARVVLSSGFGEHARVRNMLARGLCGFIPKPYTRQKLVEQMRSILEAKECIGTEKR